MHQRILIKVTADIEKEEAEAQKKQAETTSAIARAQEASASDIFKKAMLKTVDEIKKDEANPKAQRDEMKTQLALLSQWGSFLASIAS